MRDVFPLFFYFSVVIFRFIGRWFFVGPFSSWPNIAVSLAPFSLHAASCVCQLIHYIIHIKHLYLVCFVHSVSRSRWFSMTLALNMLKIAIIEQHRPQIATNTRTHSLIQIRCVCIIHSASATQPLITYTTIHALVRSPFGPSYCTWKCLCKIRWNEHWINGEFTLVSFRCIRAARQSKRPASSARAR